MNVRGGDQPGIDRVMEIAHDYALREHVHDNLRSDQSSAANSFLCGLSAPIAATKVPG